ncbi:MAG: hypothetical protein K5694_01565 [Bacilli bacterium]|nr:hypothetical protein [Bacilli bacterium]
MHKFIPLLASVISLIAPNTTSTTKNVLVDYSTYGFAAGYWSNGKVLEMPTAKEYYKQYSLPFVVRQEGYFKINIRYETGGDNYTSKYELFTETKYTKYSQGVTKFVYFLVDISKLNHPDLGLLTCTFDYYKTSPDVDGTHYVTSYPYGSLSPQTWTINNDGNGYLSRSRPTKQPLNPGAYYSNSQKLYKNEYKGFAAEIDQSKNNILNIQNLKFRTTYLPNQHDKLTSKSVYLDVTGKARDRLKIGNLQTVNGARVRRINMAFSTPDSDGYQRLYLATPAYVSPDGRNQVPNKILNYVETREIYLPPYDPYEKSNTYEFTLTMEKMGERGIDTIKASFSAQMAVNLIGSKATSRYYVEES